MIIGVRGRCYADIVKDRYQKQTFNSLGSLSESKYLSNFVSSR